ncbi:hypothetical protein Bca52824_012446 [Brassica carinata]|uniref:TF-B3 domain-containing protein n=1 Tax=Brassica carinata TaxID=52824 RepID=A0A8X7VW45_BRACI|nr:hypothetical protein Bca52824_012446 [Brassica carinata]
MSESEEDDVLPRFFKVFLSGKSSELMELPKSFNEHLQDPLPQTAKLQGIGGGVWSVSFKKIGDYAYFTSGWSKFAEDHKLKDGEFLTFVYDGSHTFEIRAVVETVNLSDANSDEEEDDDEVSQSVNPVDSEDTAFDAEGEIVLCSSY